MFASRLRGLGFHGSSCAPLHYLYLCSSSCSFHSSRKCGSALRSVPHKSPACLLAFRLLVKVYQSNPPTLLKKDRLSDLCYPSHHQYFHYNQNNSIHPLQTTSKPPQQKIHKWLSAAAPPKYTQDKPSVRAAAVQDQKRPQAPQRR